MTRTTHHPRRRRGPANHQRPQRHPRGGDSWGAWQRSESIGDPDNPRTGEIVTHRNRAFDVQELRRNGFHVLSVRPHNAQFPPSWQDLVRIKDELVGEHRQAVQVYPSRGQFMDQGHFAQLWVIPEGGELPFTFSNLHRNPPPENPKTVMGVIDDDDAPQDDRDDTTDENAG